MRTVVLTNGSTHGQRILEEFKRTRTPIAAVIVEREMPPKRPPLSECLKQLGYQTTASVVYRDLCEKLWPSLPARRYKRFSPVVRRVTDFNSPQTEQLLAELRSDLIVLGGARILKRHILERAKIAVLNAHPGLLPSYRGNDVIAWALHNGDPVGVTVHVVDAGVDTGPIIMKQELPVAMGESVKDLKLKAEVLAATMMGQVVRELMSSGQVVPLQVSGSRGPLYRAMSPDMRAALDRKLSAR
jgi:methionyl-tRNA formyltransferase